VIDEKKTREQLLSELVGLRQRVAELETSATKRKQAEALCEIAPAVGQTLELEELLNSILGRVAEVIGADMGLVYLLDMTEKALLLKVHRGVSEKVISRISAVKLSIGELKNVPGWKIPDMSFSELFGEATLKVIAVELREDQAQAVAGIPFSGKGRLHGVMVVASRSQREFSQDGMQLLGAVGKQIGIGTENAMLLEEVSRLTNIDSLTGVHNLRYFQARLGEEVARSSRYGLEFSVIMFDVDGFESYSARRGQAAGDELVRTVGKSLCDCIREVDIGCRCGGSKFAVILPHTGLAGARVVAENVRLSVEGVFKLSSIFSRFNLTISLGIASFPMDELSREGLVRQADTALSTARKQGGNQTCLAADVPSSTGTAKNGVTQVTENLRESGANIVYAMAAAVDARNPYTLRHSQNVARHAVAIGQALNLSRRQIKQLRIAALLHDIGKVGVPDDIVGKLGPLSDEELEKMRKHPELGATIVGQIPELADCAPAIRHHHERYDGSGYPGGLKEKLIPLEARILAVAEAYDNMTTPCPHRQVLSPQEALEELRRHVNTQFDPIPVLAFIKVAGAGSEVVA